MRFRTSATNACKWNLGYKALAEGDDVGTAVTSLTVTDLDSATADDLNITAALSVPASTLASTDEIVAFELLRDADATADTVDADAHFYGMLIEYETDPSIDNSL